MNRINPLYIGALLIFVLFFLTYKIYSVKDDIQEAKISYNETLKVASKLSDLKNVYNNKHNEKLKLHQLLNNSMFKDASIKQQNKKRSTTISSNSMNLDSLNLLMSKTLNATYNIKNIKIKRISDEKVSFEMEIQW